MAKVNQKKDLPQWFKIENYDNCSSLDAIDWFVHLKDRQRVYSLITGEDYAPEMRALANSWHSPEETNKNMAALGKNYAETLRKNPLTALFPVHDLMYELAESLPVRDPTQVAPIEREFFKELMIDMRHPNNTLEKAFSIWLKRLRGDQPKVKKSKAMYARWTEYGVLPYLDLKIWAQETKTHIPDRVMCMAINKVDGGVEQLRDTIAPLAERLLHDLGTLAKSAAIEASEKKITSTPRR